MNMDMRSVLGVALCICLALVLASWLYRNKLKKIKLVIGVAQTRGIQEEQEDAFALYEDSEAAIAVLADGRGTGRVPGAMLSEYAVDTFIRMFDSHSINNVEYFIQSAANVADHGIRNRINDGTGGASVAVAVFHANTLYYATCGNIQAGVFRGHDFILLNEGDTAQAIAKDRFYAGKMDREDAKALQSNTQVMRFLGIDGFSGMKIEKATLQKGDVVALLSHGIYDGLYWAEIEKEMNTDRHVQKIADAVIEAVEAGDRNLFNGTILLAKYVGA